MRVREWLFGNSRGSDTIKERTVDNVGVTCDPSDVGHAGEAVSWVDIEDVFDSQCSPEEITTGGVDNTLWLSGRSGGLREGNEYN